MIVVNGKSVELKKATPLKNYLEDAGYDLSRIAVEKNGVIVTKGSFAAEMISGGDTLEIVCFVGGG